MSGAQSHKKLLTPLCEVEDYSSSDSSSSSFKQAFQLKTKVESSKNIVMPVVTIVTNNYEETAGMKAMLEKIVTKSEEKEGKNHQVDQKVEKAPNLVPRKKLIK